MLFSLIILKQKARFYLYPGLLFSFSGIVWCVSGGAFDLALFMEHVSSNPIPYLLAFIAAIFLGLYCNVVRLFTQSSKIVHISFLTIATTLWIRCLIAEEPFPSVPLIEYLNVLITAICFASSYALWEEGPERKPHTVRDGILFHHPSFPFCSVAYGSPYFQCLLSSAA